MNVLEDFLHQIQHCTRLDTKQQPQKLLELLRLNPSSNPFIVRLNSLSFLDETQITDSIERRNWYNDDWPAFNQAVLSFIKLSNQMNAWSLLESFDLFTTYLSDLAVAFTNKSKGYLVTLLLEDVLKVVIPMAKQLDYQMLLKEIHRKPRLGYMASILLRVFNNIRSQLGAGDQAETVKKSIMLFIGIRLCRVYLLLSNPLLCRNVFSNMNNANLRFSMYPPDQQIQYRYYLAKFYMAKYQFVDAYQHLFWCLQNVPTNYAEDNPNVTKILRDFLPISIIIGKRPNMPSFARSFYSSPAKCPHFFKLYGSLAHAVKSGNLAEVHSITNDPLNSEFLKCHKIALFISSKAFLVTLRNLVKKVWVIEGKKSRLEYDSVKRALELSAGGLDLTQVTGIGPARGDYLPVDDLVVENCLVSLIDQNLLRGKVFPRLRVVSIAKSDVFSPVAIINFLKFGNGSEGTLNHADKWIGQNEAIA